MMHDETIQAEAPSLRSRAPQQAAPIDRVLIGSPLISISGVEPAADSSGGSGVTVTVGLTFKF